MHKAAKASEQARVFDVELIHGRKQAVPCAKVRELSSLVNHYEEVRACCSTLCFECQVLMTTSPHVLAQPWGQYETKLHRTATGDELVARCIPTLMRQIRGEFPPGVKAHREWLAPGGMRVVRGEGTYLGGMSEKTKDSVVEASQAWVNGMRRIEQKSDVSDDDEGAIDDADRTIRAADVSTVRTLL